MSKFIPILLIGLLIVTGLTIYWFTRSKSPTINIPLEVRQKSDSPSPVINPSSDQLSAIESSYPEAPKQTFPGYTTEQNGALIVTTNPSEARVLIDAAEQEEGSSSQIPLNEVPETKLTPFKMSQIPVGEHSVTVFKKGYAQKVIKFTVSANQVTRVEVQLSPSNNEF